MDPSHQSHSISPITDEEDEWDTDGFVIPSLGIGEPDQAKSATSETETQTLELSSPEVKEEQNKIYLGPHGAPPSQPKQQELNPAGRKQRFKQKLKEADRRISGSGREDKLENLQELVGVQKTSGGRVSKGSNVEWLDPHCDESLFEKRQSR